MFILELTTPYPYERDEFDEFDQPVRDPLAVDLSFTRPREEGGNRIHGIYFEQN